MTNNKTKSKTDNDDRVWLWNVNLAWELFSSAVYSYRLAQNSSKEHHRHSFFKTVILISVTAVEAYFNEVLAKEEGWSEEDLKKRKWSDKVSTLDINFGQERFSKSKFIRNNFIVHHKRIDYRYFVEINQISALDAIESSQDIIAEVSYKKNRIFPYWITGLNFINPSHSNDICLLNDCEFWCRFKWLGLSQIVSQMISPDGTISPPKEKKTYDSLYKELWQKLNDCNFKLDILNNAKDKRFPLMPFLTSEWWVIDPPIDRQGYYEAFGIKPKP
jgi:hypothetical protein